MNTKDSGGSERVSSIAVGASDFEPHRTADEDIDNLAWGELLLEPIAELCAPIEVRFAINPPVQDLGAAINQEVARGAVGSNEAFDIDPKVEESLFVICINVLIQYHLRRRRRRNRETR